MENFSMERSLPAISTQFALQISPHIFPKKGKLSNFPIPSHAPDSTPSSFQNKRTQQNNHHLDNSLETLDTRYSSPNSF